ncbi:MAG: DUF2868 domain-containing protein, partial [Verrucomicrobia bacterium]|nr:DUF2868 domain-containing protein [Verrucomicrobiota bacterium]
MCASPTWKTADLIDFELLLASPAGETDGPEFFTEHLASQLSPEAQVDRPQVFKAWLNAHRSSAKEVGLGLRCVASWKAIASLGSLFGLLLGGSLTATLLHYRGTEPINVTWFLFSTLGIQFLLLFVFLLLNLIRSTTGFFEDFHPLRSTLVALSNRFIHKLPTTDRDRLRVALSQFAQKGSVYHSIIPWPPLIVTQIFALAFNLGILATLLAHIAATDLAFGWQSTIQLSPAFVSHLVSLLASPWSWILPNPHPS